MLNVDIVTCDYYSWIDNSFGKGERFIGDFLPEYTWAESTLGGLVFEKAD